MSAFKDKSVLVLGGSRGIGAAIVRRFAADGAKVAFTYAGSPEAAQGLANETGSTPFLTDSADRNAVIARVRDSGPLDVLVVNAGIAIFGDARSQADCGRDFGHGLTERELDHIVEIHNSVSLAS